MKQCSHAYKQLGPIDDLVVRCHLSQYFLLCFKFDSSVNLLCLLIKVAPALFFKTAFLYLPFVYMIVSVAVLQYWDLTRSLGGVSCSSHWAALCWPPLWSGLSSALASRRRSNVSHIHVWLDYLMTQFLNSCHRVSADHWVVSGFLT